jgi:hypothetical protein
MAGLGRRPPTDWKHVERFPLAALDVADRPASVPVVLGINWYSAFDQPEYDGGRWWAGRGGIGKIRGGHAICCRPGRRTDLLSWWRFYDQGDTSACTGFSGARAMTILNRRRYSGPWLWDRAKELDEWPDTNPGDDEGSSVRAAMEALRTLGIERAREAKPRVEDGISAYRWAGSVDEVHAAWGPESAAPATRIAPAMTTASLIVRPST